ALPFTRSINRGVWSAAHALLNRPSASRRSLPAHRRTTIAGRVRLRSEMEMRKLIKNEQGIAFPMAMIVMAILSALMAAFAMLATSEPQIASNHMAGTQARALAESGLERALWALTQGENATPPSGSLVSSGPPNYTIAMVAPYDGSQEVSVGAGSFKVSVADGAQPNIKVITAVG